MKENENESAEGRIADELITKVIDSLVEDRNTSDDEKKLWNSLSANDRFINLVKQGFQSHLGLAGVDTRKAMAVMLLIALGEGTEKLADLIGPMMTAAYIGYKLRELETVAAIEQEITK